MDRIRTTAPQSTTTEPKSLTEFEDYTAPPQFCDEASENGSYLGFATSINFRAMELSATAWCGSTI
jgi:hypothetical protein